MWPVNKRDFMSISIQHKNYPLELLQVREQLLSHFRPLFNHYGVTEQQWRILRVLDQRDGIEPKALCLVCQILSPSMVGILRRMEELDLVRRQPLETDKRRMKIYLGDHGQKLMAKLGPLIDKQYEYLEEAYGMETFEALGKALDMLADVKHVTVQRVEIPEDE